MIRTPRPRTSRTTSRHGFTLVELLVVISIIAVLAGILLVALSSASNKATESKTTSTLNSFAAACDAFSMEHGKYPGIVPTHVLGDGADLTTTQNALLHLMGGCRVRRSDDPAGSHAYEAYDDYVANARQPVEITLPDPNNTSREWEIIVDLTRISEGPVIDGKPYPPYFAPKANEMVNRWSVATNPNAGDAAEQGYNQLPDLYDAWGNPIIYLERQRKGGPLVQSTFSGPGGNADPGQFVLNGLDLYVTAEALGNDRSRQKQVEMPNGATLGSRLAGANGDGELEEQRRWLTTVVAHPAFYDPEDDPWFGTARGAYILISAGSDGVFLSHQDGPLTSQGGYDEEWDDAEPEHLEEFDDIIFYGGS